jgi:hypothetical protein
MVHLSEIRMTTFLGFIGKGGKRFAIPMEFITRVMNDAKRVTLPKGEFRTLDMAVREHLTLTPMFDCRAETAHTWEPFHRIADVAFKVGETMYRVMIAFSSIENIGNGQIYGAGSNARINGLEYEILKLEEVLKDDLMQLPTIAPEKQAEAA